jgi:hypothetical protein
MASERTAACRLGVKSGGVIFTVTTPLAARSIYENIATAVGSRTRQRRRRTAAPVYLHLKWCCGHTLRDPIAPSLHPPPPCSCTASSRVRLFKQISSSNTLLETKSTQLSLNYRRSVSSNHSLSDLATSYSTPRPHRQSATSPSTCCEKTLTCGYTSLRRMATPPSIACMTRPASDPTLSFGPMWDESNDTSLTP